MSSTTEKTDGHSLEAHKSLVDWLISHGGSIDHRVQVAQDASRGVHIQVRADWPTPVSKETRVINTPMDVTMSYYNAINFSSAKGSFPNRGVDLPRAFIDAVGPEETTAFFLMGQFLLGEQGFWFPYLRTLPQPGQLTTPLFFGEEDVDWIQGTGIPDASVFRFRVWDEKYESSMTKLDELGFGNLEPFTWDLYLWASTIITSRAFSPKVLGNVIDESDSLDGVSVLLPVIDLPNHRPLAKVEWRAGERDVGMIVLEEVAPGQELSNNYGPRNNEQLLMNYGFCIQNNPTDYRVVKLGVKSDSPLGQAKARQTELFPELAKNTDDHYYIFNLFYPLLNANSPMEHSIISPALFNALTVMEANERERKKIEITESNISIQKAYGNSRSTLAALAQICLELMSHINQLQVTGRDLPAQPGNLKQMFAQLYRSSLSTIDKTALVITTWTMTRAREQERSESREDDEALLNEYLSKIPAGCFSDEILAQIRVKVLEKQSLIPKNGELFRLQELFTLLPTELRAPAQSYLARLLTPLELGPDFLFALMICFLVATARTANVRSKLPSRLTRWADFLVEEYPLEAGRNAPESQARQALRQLSNGREEIIATGSGDGVTWLTMNSEWLDEEWLQWACSVAEEERVLIPFDPLQVLVNDEPALVKQAVLYIPQE